jgi:hypothetical protein
MLNAKNIPESLKLNNELQPEFPNEQYDYRITELIISTEQIRSLSFRSRYNSGARTRRYFNAWWMIAKKVI